ncbi:MAG: DUF4402 domain-containing protein [Pontixanthobacter sp.]
MTNGLRAVVTVVMLMAMGLPHAQAAPRQLTISNDGNLRFGSFAVFDDAYRIVSPSGAVQSSGLFSITNGDTAPARFTIRYDRGNASRRRLDLRIQLVLSAAPVVTQGGIVARLTSYTTDLPRAGVVQAGRVIEVDIPNCVQRICSTSFAVGARLDIRRNFGGGDIEIPIPVDAVLISVR